MIPFHVSQISASPRFGAGKPQTGVANLPRFGQNNKAATSFASNVDWINRNITQPADRALKALRQRRFKSALQQSSHALEHAELLGEENVHLARAQSVKGYVLMKLSDTQSKDERNKTLARAEELLNAANGFYVSDYRHEKVGPDRVVEPLECKVWLAETYWKMGHANFTRVTFMDADSYAQRTGLSRHPLRAYALRELATFLHDRGQLPDAASTFKQAIEVYKTAVDPINAAEAYLRYADLLEETNQLEKAIEMRLMGEVMCRFAF